MLYNGEERLTILVSYRRKPVAEIGPFGRGALFGRQYRTKGQCRPAIAADNLGGIGETTELSTEVLL